ncbi:T9SS type B sorting domain-containing protein [Olleya sp. HaHaR_3_96]|uniref:T9SS type B sorting domain-containing protein n=1 Tax=Olleya sp. HaHaR_3_96 TaxID=2745560 RepID=UPI001C4FA1F3|nr:T9SS type B sorting domain-containing protein [Olleya sp. HaHaR_3_96]QXP61488.1 T9SS type B sorting domain-containing protein [Olleya sp. HaHaR_3_96]
MKILNYTLLIICFINSNLAFCQQPTDCIQAITICGNSNVSLDVSGIGTQELTGSNTCSSQESNSIWLKVTTVNDGTLAFTLTPESNNITEDYDFFVFGPNVTCGNIGQAIRCSTTNPQESNQGNNLTGLSVNANDTAEGPGGAGNSFVSAINATAGDSYYIVIDRPIGNSPFSLEWTGTAQFAEPPANSAINQNEITLENCDLTLPYDDEITTFNLELNTPIIRGNQNNVTITYHESESDANINSDAISSPYTNISNPQTLYAKVTNTITDCYTIVPFNLTIKNGPTITIPTDYQVCDDTTDGNDTNGQSFFILSSKNNEIGGRNASNYIFSYHSTFLNALNNTDVLSDNFYNTTPNQQTIYVRVENALDVGCISITPLNLVVNPIITTFDSILFQCDDDDLIDGFTIFNLDEAITDITDAFSSNNQVDFYENYTDATSQTNELNSLAYSNISNPQTVIAVVTNPITGCFETAQLILEVSTTSINNYIAPPVCDEVDSEDGLNTFDLSEFSTAILSGLPPNLDINYYDNYNDALLEQNALPNNYNNTTPYNQIIYVRVEDNNTCYGINEVALSILELPQLEADETLLYCLNNFPEALSITGGVIGNSNNYYYNWNTGDTTINVEVNAIGTYVVTVTNTLGCSKSRTITVEPSNIATINDIIVVDSTIDNNQVTILTSGEGEYQFELINFSGESTGFQSSNIFNNISPGFYTATVKDIKNDCGTIDQLFSVVGFPLYFTPNNDSQNDYWQVYGVSSQFQPNSVIQIFDRYGKLIKQFAPSSQGWDGTFNGLPMPTNDYWFTVKLQDGRIYKDHFTLKR